MQRCLPYNALQWSSFPLFLLKLFGRLTSLIASWQVSGGLFSRLVATNPALKHLNARGCTNLMSHTVSDLHMGEGYGWEDVEMGWGLSDAALKSVGYENCRLRGLVVGVGAAISDVALVSLSEQCRELNRLSLRFQVTIAAISLTLNLLWLSVPSKLEVKSWLWCLLKMW